MKNIFTEKQIVEFQESSKKVHEINTLLMSLLRETETKGIQATTPNAEATLKGMVAYLRGELQIHMSITTEYNRITNSYNAERDRICNDLDDPFMVKPETIEALAKLDEEFYQRNANRENGIEEETVRFNQI